MVVMTIKREEIEKRVERRTEKRREESEEKRGEKEKEGRTCSPLLNKGQDPMDDKRGRAFSLQDKFNGILFILVCCDAQCAHQE